MGGTPPFGFQYHEGELVEHSYEQETIAAMQQLRSEGMSYGVIAGSLNARKQLNRGKWWNPTTVWNLLKREEANG